MKTKRDVMGRLLDEKKVKWIVKKGKLIMVEVKEDD